MASVSDVGESSQDHDRDDHGASEEGNVRMTVHERHVQESADPIGSTQTLGMMRLKGDVQSAGLSHCPYGLQGFLPHLSGHFGGHQHGD